ncbi:MAG: glycosyltransferase family 4 protein [Deferribacteres bacterium]|nr:glycosyltransferase family 4 protein [candidate division KSB1 bacterium]MCB9503375.1 glycosyltransferase family 4 protein [Deferribacteres bacterium]
MVISYFNYLWDIDGISAGSAIKGREFVAGLRRLGHKVYLEWREKQPEEQVNHSRNGTRNSLKPYLQKYLKEPKILLKNIPQLYQDIAILKSQKPDVFFPRLEYGNVSAILAAKMLKIPVVVEADCPPTHEWVEFYGKNFWRFKEMSSAMELFVLRNADAVITQSNALSDYYIKQGIPATKITMITNGADIEKFAPREKDTKILDKHNLHGKTVIGWVGAGISWTGIGILVETIGKLLRENKNLALLMVGSKENMEEMQKSLVTEEIADQVVLAGFIPFGQVPNYVSCMDIVLAPYPDFDFFYASSMKLFEYMAAGKAIVATEVGQIAEVIEDGKNGFLFNRQNVAGLYEKISKLVASKDLREELGKNARIDAEKIYNWDIIAARMIDVFEKIKN